MASSGDAGTSSGGDAGACANCAAPQVCRLGTCLDPPPACTGDDACPNDARCVAQECIPFGVGGDTNPDCAVLVPLGVFSPTIQCEWQPPSTGTPCTNPCAAGELCTLDEDLTGPYCATGGAVFPADDAGVRRACTNPCTAPREVCMQDGTGTMACQDPYRQLLSTVTVMDFDFDNDPNTLRPSLVFASYGFRDGSLPSGSRHGVLRVVDGRTCATQHTLDGVDPVTGLVMRVPGSSTPALGDINGDGRPDIVAHAQGGGLWAFGYNAALGAFAPLWRATHQDGGISTALADVSRWSGPSLFDLDDDAVPEILMEAMVFNAQGRLLGEARQAELRFNGTGPIPVAADVDRDGFLELVTGRAVYDFEGGDWVPKAASVTDGGFDGLVALGDFGAFDPDGGAADAAYPEVVVVNGQVRVRTLDGRDVFPAQLVPPAGVMRANGAVESPAGGGGGAPTVGDFDGDGRAEFAEAGGRAYTVFDFDCLGSNQVCTEDSNCATGEHCPVAGRCSRSSTPCSQAAECPGGEDCFVLYPQPGRCGLEGGGVQEVDGGVEPDAGRACQTRSNCRSEEFCYPDGPGLRHCVPLGCQGHGILWTQVSQDLSSNRTASSIFDFEADGRVEAVYSDECYTRVYDGRSGAVLFSQMRTSCTWYENPVIADVDGDLRSEIVIGSNENCTTSNSCAANAFVVTPGVDGGPPPVLVDPIYAGLRCQDAAGCPGANAQCLDGLCRCSTDLDCGASGGFVCGPVLAGSTSNAAKVCRAQFQPDVLDGRPGLTGVRVYADQADRWVGSRPVWNQHAYSITHVGDRGEIPRSSQMARNWETPGLNNYRQNVQGNLNGNAAPDVTSGGAAAGACQPVGDGRYLVPLQARICNRGTAPVGASIPVSFYAGDASPQNLVCTTATTLQLDPGACQTVGCDYANAPEGASLVIVVRADDDGTGAGARQECLEGNNGTVLGGLSCSVSG